MQIFNFVASLQPAPVTRQAMKGARSCCRALGAQVGLALTSEVSLAGSRDSGSFLICVYLRRSAAKRGLNLYLHISLVPRVRRKQHGGRKPHSACDQVAWKLRLCRIVLAHAFVVVLAGKCNPVFRRRNLFLQEQKLL